MRSSTRCMPICSSKEESFSTESGNSFKAERKRRKRRNRKRRKMRGGRKTFFRYLICDLNKTREVFLIYKTGTSSHNKKLILD
ncbi:hypothetical protein Cadr_000023979 [Camelus dromedarius]|uniref:Uncharacterized protein n=1 Tax=Camelus dromedarius TaxID=9838 RepID=A0A5N4CWI3_CAMDR|nr:hypothetical protein Cadr_000023979 [Camelus dromedarius]